MSPGERLEEGKVKGVRRHRKVTCPGKLLSRQPRIAAARSPGSQGAAVVHVLEISSVEVATNGERENDDDDRSKDPLGRWVEIEVEIPKQAEQRPPLRAIEVGRREDGSNRVGDRSRVDLRRLQNGSR